MEEALADVDEPYAGVVVEKMSQRKGEIVDMRPSGGGKLRLTFRIPSRGLIGYHGEFLTDTRGTGVMNRLFAGYGPWRGDDRRPPQRRADLDRREGEAVQYSLFYLQDRGALFISPGEKVYAGMIIGEHSRGQRPRRESAQREETHQHSRRRQGRGAAPDSAAPDVARGGDRLCRRR